MKFFVVGSGLFTGISVVLYPVSVVKTRLQVASKGTLERSALSVVKGLLKTDGIPGLYKGFTTVITGTVPARIIFLTALETTNMATLRMMESLRVSETTQAAIANGIAGMAAAVFSQAVFVPIDVVSQKLMVQGCSGHAQYTGGLDVARKVLRSDGIRGLYRGFGLSLITYTPSNAVWWASYGSSKRFLRRFLGDSNSEEGTLSLPKIILVQATGGIIAGATASCITTPLDTIKTRLQYVLVSAEVLNLREMTMKGGRIRTPFYDYYIIVVGVEKKISVKQVVKDLIVEDGWKGLYRGLGPRFVSVSAWGTSMVLAYEYLKRLCAKDEVVSN